MSEAKTSVMEVAGWDGIVLTRFPEGGNTSLQAWDAADEYALAHLAELGPESLGSGWLLVNDAFGALTVALAQYGPQSWSDSFLAHQGASANLVENGLEPQPDRWVRSTEDPTGPVDVVIIKIPPALALLEDQLYRLRPHLHAKSVVVGAGMTKHIHNSTTALFEKIIGPTKTSLAKKKARLIFSELDESLDPGPPPQPTVFEVGEGVEYHDGMGAIEAIEVMNQANVFSREHLDRGTSLLLENLPETRGEIQIVDMGCGNGILGTVAAMGNEAAELTFTDESYMAVASAEATFRGALGKKRKARFLVTDCLDGIDNDSVDVILNNPPFHDRIAVDDAVAWRMFTESHRALKSGGEIRVVGNRHLGYHVKLKKIFGNSRVVSSDPRFVVLSATR